MLFFFWANKKLWWLFIIENFIWPFYYNLGKLKESNTSESAGQKLWTVVAKISSGLLLVGNQTFMVRSGRVFCLALAPVLDSICHQKLTSIVILVFEVASNLNSALYIMMQTLIMFLKVISWSNLKLLYQTKDFD